MSDVEYDSDIIRDLISYMQFTRNKLHTGSRFTLHVCDYIDTATDEFNYLLRTYGDECTSNGR